MCGLAIHQYPKRNIEIKAGDEPVRNQHQDKVGS